MEVVPTGRDYTVLIDYAVTPDALDNMIRTVRDTAAGRVGVLFGCGGDRDRTKRPKMGRVVAELADYVIITSDNPRTEDPEAIIADILPGLEGLDTPRVVIPDRREAIRWGLEHAQPGDTLVLTGKGHETYQIVGKTKYHMDEREIVAEVLGT
jgi:UDP-N-acetylmuramoyl-L-alanyl-D-glutamate--2,6-diaminopimelate ligase